MTAEQQADAIELLVTRFIELIKKKELQGLLDKPERESLHLLQQALQQARRDKGKRKNAWLKD